MKKENILSIGLILLQSVFYGFGNPITKIGYESISPLWLLLVRFVIASLLYWAFFGKATLDALKKYPVMLWLPSALCCSGAYISGNLALNLTSSTNVGFLISLPLIFTPFTCRIILGRKFKIWEFPLIALTVAGLFLLCSNGGFFEFGPGEALALLDSLFVALLYPFGEKAMKEMDCKALTTLQVSVTTLIISVITLAFDSPAGISSANVSGFMVAVYLAVTCSFLSYLFQNTAVKYVKSQTVSLIQCTQPILTAVFSYYILSESLSPIGFIGAAIIIVCILANGFIYYIKGKNA